MRKIIAIALIATGVASCKTVKVCEDKEQLMQMYKLGYLDGALSELRAYETQYVDTFIQDSTNAYELIKED